MVFIPFQRKSFRGLEWMKEEGNKKAVGGEKCKIRDRRPPGGGEQTE